MIVGLRCRIVPDELKPEIRQRFFQFFDEGDYQVSPGMNVVLRPGRSDLSPLGSICRSLELS